MADMDELFGSDGDSDNDQRGNDVSQPLKILGVYEGSLLAVSSFSQC